MILDIKKIYKLLPHRFPFLLIDKVIDHNEGVYAEAIKNVSINEWFFQGHFPNEPIFPGVLILEAMAQTAGVAILSEENFRRNIPSSLYFVGIDKVLFKDIVRPGDTLTLKAKKTRSMMGFYIFEAFAEVENKVVAQAIIKATIGKD